MTSDEATEKAAKAAPVTEPAGEAVTPQAAETEPAPASSPASPPASGGSGAVTSLADKFFIHPQKPLPQFDQGPVKAYGVTQGRDAVAVDHFALICEPHLTPRARLAGAYNGISNPNVIRLVGSGVIYWPPTSEERYTFIYEKPAGPPLMRHNEFKGLDMKPDIVVSSIIRPLVGALADIRDRDMAHGNVRPSNIFAAMSGDVIDRIVLGDCLATPPSYAQPIIFETIERAMADPIARGLPSQEDDMYALGVTLALLLRSRDPLEDMSDEDIIRQKIENGSYTALLSRDRFTGAILEPLRGLLYDDPAQRWSVSDLQQWMDGQRLSPKQAAKKVKAARPLHFNEERYFRPSLLAMDLHKDPGAAVQLVENNHMEQWISRSLDDPQVMKRYESVVESMTELGRGAGYWDRLLCRLSIALDPDAPIRYKGLSLTADGIGTALAQAVVKKEDIAPYAELISQQTVMFWVGAAPAAQMDVGALVGRFDACRAFLRQTSPAYGIERCLYFLNSECHCLSDKLKGYLVRTPEDLLRAFEKISSSPKRPELFLDRHVTAFLSVKDRKDIDPYLIELGADEPYKRILGNIKTLATIQQRSRMEKLPGICGWMADILDPVLAQLHDRDLRISLGEKIRKIAAGGDITKIAALLDDPKITQDDTKAYNEARMEYFKLRQESMELQADMADPDRIKLTTGREMAAIFSCILAGVIMLFFAFMFFTKSSGL
ncbi:protein kinase family protein [Micavibrio aeruginosavorus]|uniref:Protein kinase domain-containing protein n=1 Tax=Micavibrio aeruginosavorus EPB TaxID=349215 RepID=M4VFR8_9BACT|nr:hypothetical protein [Micavibrio aeruginosavorus]AGH97335.1 hypothetical protein A11S_508 [Micavibrio aeruginosavorus EPB]